MSAIFLHQDQLKVGSRIRLPATETPFSVVRAQANELTRQYRRAGLVRLDGGEGGIRTHGPRKRTAVFKTAAFDHSATSPRFKNQPLTNPLLGLGSDYAAYMQPPKAATA
jgi:hypothetical protein